jgi:hypothetical protein
LKKKKKKFILSFNLHRHHIQPITNLSRLSFKKFEKPLKKIGVRGALPPPSYQLQGRPPYTTSTAMRIKPTWLKSCRFRTQKKNSNFNGSWYIYRSTSAAYNCPEQQFLSFIALFISRQSNLFAFYRIMSSLSTKREILLAPVCCQFVHDILILAS